MRGYGVPQMFFALESLLEDIARELKLDPIEFRRQNLIAVGHQDPLTEERGALLRHPRVHRQGQGPDPVGREEAGVRRPDRPPAPGPGHGLLQLRLRHPPGGPGTGRRPHRHAPGRLRDPPGGRHRDRPGQRTRCSPRSPPRCWASPWTWSTWSPSRTPTSPPSTPAPTPPARPSSPASPCARPRWRPGPRCWPSPPASAAWPPEELDIRDCRIVEKALGRPLCSLEDIAMDSYYDRLHADPIKSDVSANVRDQRHVLRGHLRGGGGGPPDRQDRGAGALQRARLRDDHQPQAGRGPGARRRQHGPGRGPAGADAVRPGHRQAAEQQPAGLQAAHHPGHPEDQRRLRGDRSTPPPPSAPSPWASAR